MTKWNRDSAFIAIFGECQVTVFRGVHLVMTWDSNNYIVQESMSRKIIASAPKKGLLYKALQNNYHPSNRI